MLRLKNCARLGDLQFSRAREEARAEVRRAHELEGAVQEELRQALIARIQDKEEVIAALRAQLAARSATTLSEPATTLPVPGTVTTSPPTTVTTASGAGVATLETRIKRKTP